MKQLTPEREWLKRTLKKIKLLRYTNIYRGGRLRVRGCLLTHLKELRYSTGVQHEKPSKFFLNATLLAAVQAVTPLPLDTVKYELFQVIADTPHFEFQLNFFDTPQTETAKFEVLFQRTKSCFHYRFSHLIYFFALIRLEF